MEELANHADNLLGIRFTSAQRHALEIYQRELLAWNTRVNLTAISDPGQIQIKHFLDSLTCLSVLRDSPMDTVIDVGTGAGFPGLPIKIVQPTVQLTLVESVGKKADFCRQIVHNLGLIDVEVVQSRAETLGQTSEHRQSYDWAVARAVANMSTLVEYLLPFVKVGGAALAMKGESGPAEMHAAEHATHMLGGQLRKLVPITLPGVAEERFLVVIDKVAATPNKYPRRIGIPAKKPLQ